MPAIVESGTAPNLVNANVAGSLQPDPTPRKFVTFVNELGGMHTIIVDAEHAAKDAAELLQWFEHTRGLVTASASLPTDANHRTPEEVIATANARMGYGDAENVPPQAAGKFDNPQGG